MTAQFTLKRSCGVHNLVVSYKAGVVKRGLLTLDRDATYTQVYTVIGNMFGEDT